MAASYVEGKRYLKNRNTGVVFNFNERIASLNDLEEYVGVVEGESVVLRKSSDVRKPDPQLAPAKTPEKKVETAPAVTKPAETKPPTLAPVEK